jgi:glycerol-3-phosphate dehydrogenase
LPDPLALRLCRNYGTRAGRIIGGATALDELGEHFGAGLYAAEVDYLISTEWAHSADDILWRRTKLGLRVGPAERERLQQHVEQRTAASEALRKR